MNNKPLEVKSEIDNIGVLIDDKLRFSHHISEKVNKANQIMGLICRNCTHMDQHNFILLFISLVRIYLEYPNLLWSPILKKHIQLIEYVQQRATRYISVINHLSVIRNV